MPRSFLSSLLSLKCPRCRKGDLFFTPWSFETAYKMPDKCPNCGLSYLPEPGYWYGAMFLSYIVTAFLFLALALVAVFVFKWSVFLTFAILLVFALITHNFFFRFARSLWIHLMVKYKGEE